MYNAEGQAVAYVDADGESIYLYDGTPAGFLQDGGIYAYSGRFVGWFEQGWVRDSNGHAVFFTESAGGGPIRPVRQVRPVRGVRQVRPVRGVREVRPVRPVFSSTWSAVSHEGFFEE